MKPAFITVCIVISTILLCNAQSFKSSSKQNSAQKVATGNLVPVQTIEARSEAASTFSDPLNCDADGNLYLQSDDSGVSGVRKLNAKGERVALFQPNANPDLKVDSVGYFAIRQDGAVDQLVFPREITRYVMTFKPDGTYKSTIKLQPGFAWIPYSLAVFPSGDLLVSGLEFVKDKNKHAMLPFTGIFSSDGALLKEVKLKDDDALYDLAASGDARVSSTTDPSANHAIEFGQVQPASDGNIYLMRWITPTIFYAISPGGEVVRRFVVDPGDDTLRPSGMHVSGDRIAVLYFQPQTMEKRMKILDLEGHELATYEGPKDEGKLKEGVLGTAFACYSENPQRFIFLTTGEGDRLQYRIAEGR